MSAFARLSPQTRDAVARTRRRYLPRQRMSTAAWARRYRYLARGETPMRFDFDGQPAIEGILDAFDDPRVRELWVQKSSQFGYTQGVELNILGKRIHLEPSPALVIFPKDDAHERWNREKLVPAIKATPVLAAIIPTDRPSPTNTQDYKAFPGGFVQLVGGNSPANVKSTDAPLVIVSEPDDTSRTVGGVERSQGDTITLGRERLKSFADGKLVVGGTPTVKDLSQIEAGMERTDKRRFFVECPHCGHAQHLRWEQVRWDDDAPIPHPVYGVYRPETAYYQCEACVDGKWSDAQKNAAIRAAAARPDKGWRAMATFNGSAGCYVHELMSVMPGSSFEIMARKYLEANHELKHLGNDAKMRAFRNNQLGLSFERKGNTPEVEQLVERLEQEQPYAEWTVPAGALVVTGFVDVQRGSATDSENPARLELLLRAWGRELESWLVYFGQIPGNPLEPATWDALDKLLATPIRHEGGGILGISRYGVDAGDGMTSDAVLSYVRRARRKGLRAYASKGAKEVHREIFTPPSMTLDVNAADKASKYGLKLFFIGTQRAKDDIAGRLRLKGNGPRRMHWYRDVPVRYFEQLTNEVQVPNRAGKMVWVEKAGKRNEALDCEVGALHGALGLRLSSLTEAQWRGIEAQVLQADLLKSQAQNAAPSRVDGAAAPAAKPGARGPSAPPASPSDVFNL